MNDVSPNDASDATPYREVNYEFSKDFLPILQHLKASLLVSTYQAGKVTVVGQHNGELVLSLHNFEKAMGIAVGDRRIAIGAKGIIWLLEDASDLASRIEPVGRYDGLYLVRKSFVTGNIHGHEMAWSGDQLWVVNTLFSCLCTLHEDFSYVPRWRPPFVTELVAEDRCHLNGLAMVDGQPKYVTVMAESNQAGGWRESKATTGCVLDVVSGEVVARGFAMPHSPRIHNGQLWVLDSGNGKLCTVDQSSGKVETVAVVPGYTRGLAFAGQFAFVGMSKIRETSVFGGLPIAENPLQLRCGVAVIDLSTGQAAAFIQFNSGVEEVFDVQFLHTASTPTLRGPYPDLDATQAVWMVPRSDQVSVVSSMANRNPFRRS